MDLVCLITDQKHRHMEEIWQVQEPYGEQLVWEMMILVNQSSLLLIPSLNSYRVMYTSKT